MPPVDVKVAFPGVKAHAAAPPLPVPPMVHFATSTGVVNLLP